MMQSGEEVIWHEGMLMTPQHLQVSLSSQQAKLAQHLRAFGAPPVGVFHLRWDTTHLDHGLLSLAEADLLMPSGLALKWSDEAVAPSLSIDLSSWRSIPPQRTRLFLCVPRLSATEPNLVGLSGSGHSALDEAGHTRFRVTARQVRDWTEPSEQVQTILFAQPRIQLMVEEQLDDRFESLPVGLVEHTAQGVLQLDPQFTPPCLRLAAAPNLAVELGGLARGMHQLIQRLAPSERLQNSLPTARLGSLYAALPLVIDAAFDPQLTPRQIYTLLRHAAGHLACWVQVETATCLMRTHYDPAHVADSLRPLLVLLKEALQASHPQTSQRAVFKRLSSGSLCASLAAMQIPERCRWYLTVSNTHPAFTEEAERWLRLCKLAAASWLSRHVQSALPAVGMHVVKPSSTPFSFGENTLVCAVDGQHPSWLAGLREQSLALAVPHEPALPCDAEVALLGLSEAA